jgi:hypothetical protein
MEIMALSIVEYTAADQILYVLSQLGPIIGLLLGGIGLLLGGIGIIRGVSIWSKQKEKK